jgi:peptidoglycan/xylan/chitin deacetylase (PgdA/CDA1 family)
VKKILKALISRAAFALGLTPTIEKAPADPRRFIPKPFRAVLIISADFELAWAWQYARAYDDPLKEAMVMARRSRENILVILKLCEEYEIPVTWATVGHLFLESCNKKNGMPHAEIQRLPYLENEFWKFDRADWFQNDPCSSVNEAPEWYAPDLVRKIIDAKVKHEIGCHTFSHIDCRDQICSRDVFESEIRECIRLAGEYGLELKSFVHPAHTIGHLQDLSAMGFTSYRTDYGNILGYAEKRETGLWELKGTAELTLRKAWSIPYHIHRYRTIVERAMKYGKVCNFWFHPSLDPMFVKEMLPPLFHFIRERRDKIWITTAGEYIDWLNGSL